MYAQSLSPRRVLSGAAFLRQSGRVQNLSPLRVEKYTGLVLRSLDALLFFCLFILFLLVFSLSFLGIWRALSEPASRVPPGRPSQGLLLLTSDRRPLEIPEVSDTQPLSGDFFVKLGFDIEFLLFGCGSWCGPHHRFRCRFVFYFG